MQNPPAPVGGFFIGCRQCRLVITGLAPVMTSGKCGASKHRDRPGHDAGAIASHSSGEGSGSSACEFVSEGVSGDQEHRDDGNSQT
jgi:hypothetical protein